MKNIIFTNLFFLLTLPLLAQNSDYIITEEGDTLYGKVRRSVLFQFGGRTLKISDGSGIQKFRYSEYKAYQKNGTKYMKVLLYSNKGKELRWFCPVVLEGRLSLLRERSAESPSYFLYYDGVFYMITRRYFPNEVWQKLIQCPAFADKYKNYHKETGGKTILYPRDPKIWYEIVEYYNRYCPD